MKAVYFYSFLLLIIFQACKSGNKEIHPVYKELTEAVYASGNIYPKNDYKVFANADGFLQAELVNEGDIVNPGQVMFHIENVMQNARYESAADIYHKAMDNYKSDSPVLTELKSNLAASLAKYQNDSINYVRYKDLFKNNFTTEQDYNRAELTYTVSKNEYLAKLSNYSKVHNQLYVDMKNAEANYKVNAKDDQNYQVRSFIHGKVYEIMKEKGEAIRRNDPIAILGDPDKLYVKLMIDELDIASIHIGQEVFIKADIDRTKIFKAKVTKIYPKLIKEDQTFRVDAEFYGEQPTSYYGLTIEANILVNKKAHVLIIPKTYLLGGDSVLLVNDKVKSKVKVVKGISDFEFVEITSGLTESSVISLP